MAPPVPRHALTLLANSAKLATRHGFTKGLGKAASKANPALLVIEAAVSVADAVNSYLKLREAKAHRTGLRELIPHEEDRLRLERHKLIEQLGLAKEEIAQKKDLQRRLGELALACGKAWRTVWTELHAIRTSDLPDLEAFDRQQQVLEDTWADLRHALGNYNETTA